jgi:hypothetical protein
VSRAIARGWATVDIDRAVRELSGLLQTGAAFEPVARSPVLGARCVRGPSASADAPTPEWIVVLEPDTEGRAAAFLARHGEGWAATWLADDAVELRAPSDGSPGPFGPETLEPGGPPRGPYRLRVSAATIEP